MRPELPTDWRTRARIHPSQDLVACQVGRHRDDHGVGIWRRDGSRIAWLSRALDLAWLGETPGAVVVFARGHRSEPPLPRTQIVARISAPSWEIAGELSIDVDINGCAIEEITASPSGRWAATRRSSGQGESGFDIIEIERMERVGGIAWRTGYMLPPPAFALDETRVLTGIGPWLGGWWAHPDDEPDEPSRGGVVDFGSLFEVRLDSHELRSCALELAVPQGWLPKDPWSGEWYGPTEIEPFHQGARMTLPGGDRFEHPAPLPSIVRLPSLHAFADAVRR